MTDTAELKEDQEQGHFIHLKVLVLLSSVYTVLCAAAPGRGDGLASRTSRRITAVRFGEEERAWRAVRTVVSASARARRRPRCCAEGLSVDDGVQVGGKQHGPFIWLSFGRCCEKAPLSLQIGISKHSRTSVPGISAPRVLA